MSDSMTDLESRIDSKKYPGVLVLHEICLDWIIDFFMDSGNFPNLEEITVGMGWVSDDVSFAAINILFAQSYLVRKEEADRIYSDDTLIKWTGQKMREIRVKTLYARVMVSPLPRKMTSEEAMDLAWKLDATGRQIEAERRK